MDRLKVIMISFAHQHAVSYFHALQKNEHAEIVAIADEAQERVREFTAPHGIPYYADYREALKLDADAVVICAENVRHEPIVIEAAKAGKHILCEKPLGTTAEGMRRMIDACKAYNVQLMTAFPCRYLPAVQQAKRSVERGDIGDIIAMNGTNRGTMPGKWFIRRELSGGGAVLDHTVHVMDLMHWFTGATAKSVYAHAETLFHPIDIDDAGMVHVTFDNGVAGVLDPSWSRPRSFPTWGDVTLEIVGTKGVIHIDALNSINEVYANDVDHAIWSYYGDNMDEAMINDFVACLRSGRPVPITGEDGMRAAMVALAAYESAAKGRVVDIDGAAIV